MTEAVIREFAARTRFRVVPADGPDADAVLHGTILKQYITPLTYNAATQQSSSFSSPSSLSVTLTARDGSVLYENKNYVFRQQYQSTTDLPTFIQEDPAADSAPLPRVCPPACRRRARRLLERAEFS